MNFLEFNDNNSEIERDVPSPRSREAIIWMLGNKSYETQKKKKHRKNKNLRAQAGKLKQTFGTWEQTVCQ